MAWVVSDAWRSDSRSLEDAADSEIDTDIDVRYAGASRALTPAWPPVTEVQPTTTAITAAALPTSRPPIRSPRAVLISTARRLPGNRPARHGARNSPTP